MTNRTKIIAHRGASFNAPENTLEAVKLAWKQDTDAVEIDVQLTSDGQIVVFHDDNTLRMTGVQKVVAKEKWAVLQDLMIKSNDIQTRIPLLSEILETIPKEKILVVEIKSGIGIIQPLKVLIERYHIYPENIQFISLDEKVMSKVIEAFPGYETQRVFEFDKEQPDPVKLIHYAKHTPFDGIDLERGAYIDSSFVQAVHNFGKKIYIWTVNDALEAVNYVKMGIDGITTDRPGWMKKQLGRQNES